jgi:hypothetical protein
MGGMLTALREHECVRKAMLIQSDEHATRHQKVVIHRQKGTRS